jgi:hypothetical protein
MVIEHLTKDNIGQWVRYIPTGEEGKIKSWNDKYVFVVFKCDEQWKDYRLYTAVSCRPQDIEFVTVSKHSISQALRP